MKSFMSRKSGVVKNRAKVRSLRFESLEDRQLLAGGGVTTEALLEQIAALQAQLVVAGGGGGIPVQQSPMFRVTNDRVPLLTILPGATNKVVAQISITTIGRQFGRIDELFVLAAPGSEPISSTANHMSVYLDANNNMSDGYEKLVGMGSADWESDVARLHIWTPIWARQNQTVKFQIKADFNTSLSGSKFGVETAMASFYDLKNQLVNDSRVLYNGIRPVLHNLETSTLSAYQQTMIPYQSVTAGQDGVKLLEFDAWGNNTRPTSFSVVASHGGLGNADDYQLNFDQNYDGTPEQTYPGTVSEAGDRVTFQILSSTLPPQPAAKAGGPSSWGGRYWVSADMADSIAGDPHIQLAIPANGVTGINATTGRTLKGVIFNGEGEGQVQIWAQPVQATLFTIVSPEPTVTVKEIESSLEYAQVNPGDTDIVLDSFTFYAGAGVDVNLNAVTIVANTGSFSGLSNIVLWFDADGDNFAESILSDKYEKSWTPAGEAIRFQEGLNLLVQAGETVLVQVRADVADAVYGEYGGYNVIRAQLDADGVRASLRETGLMLPFDEVFIEHHWQTMWSTKGSGGLG